MSTQILETENRKVEPEVSTSKIAPKELSTTWSLIFVICMIFLLAGVLYATSQSEQLPIKLTLGEKGKSLPEEKRYAVINDRKVELFPLVYKMNGKIPYAPAYRVALYHNSTKIMQRDIMHRDLEEGVVGFPMDSKGNHYEAVVEAMYGGDERKTISNLVSFTY